MERLFSLYKQLYSRGVKVYDERLFSSCEARAVVIEEGQDYAIFLNTEKIYSSADELCLIAHEAGHIETGATHRVTSPMDLIERHEYRANKWAIKKLVPKDELCEAFRHGITEPWELAEHFTVTEPFMKKALAYYENQFL